MSSSSFTTLIVTYNSADDILYLLADLRKYAPAGRIILIDNASSDETVRSVRTHHPDVELICNPENVGYARAVNQGFDLCDTEHVLLLNPDIRITGSQLFAALESCLRTSRRVAAAAPLQFKSDEKKRWLNYSWSYTNTDSFRLYLAFVLGPRKTLHTPIEVTFLNAGCLFIRRSAFYEVGKLNEKYFMYGEEPDLFFKFKRHGFVCYLLPDVDVTHYREHSLSTVPLATRLHIKFRAALNIIDALITGWSRMLTDRPVVRPKKKTGKRLRLT